MTDIQCNHCNPVLTVKNGTNEEIMLAQVPENLAPGDSAEFLDSGYALPLKALPSADHVKTIKPNSSADIKLIISQNPPSKPEDLAVDLIAMRTADLFPTKRFLEVPSPCKGNITGKCKDHDCQFGNLLEVTPKDAEIMENSLAYYKLVTSYPGTKNAQKLADILQSAIEGTIEPEEAEKEINAFFASLTSPYNNCTFDSFATVMTFAQSYASVWADFQESYIYYVYMPNDAGTEAKPAWKKIGTIEFHKTESVNLENHAAGYSINYSTLENPSKKIALTIKDGQFVQKDKPDLSTMILLGGFQLKSDLTLKTDDNILLPVLAGQIGSQKVMAISLDIPPKKSKGVPWWDIVDSTWGENFWRYLVIIGLTIGLIVTSYKGVRFLRSKTRKGKTEKEKQDFQDKVAEAMKKVVAEKIKKPSRNLRIYDDINYDNIRTNVTEIRKMSTSEKIKIQKRYYEDLIDSYQDSIDLLSNVSSTPSLQKAQESLDEVADKLNKISSQDFPRTEFLKNLDQVSKSIGSTAKKISENFSREEKLRLDDLADECRELYDKTDGYWDIIDDSINGEEETLVTD